MVKTALITGASSGIGKELARIHAKNGGNLVIVARSEDKLKDLQGELERTQGVEVHVIVKDLTTTSAAQEIYNEAKNKGIAVDYLINNAGFGGHGKFHERDWEDDLAMIHLNVVALTALSRKFLPDFVNRNSGRILNVSSTASLMPGPLQAVYFATKAYVTSFSNAIAEELSDTKVTVTALLPGATETDFAETAGMADADLFQNTFSAREVAQAGYDAMLQGKLEVMAGLTFGQKVMMKTLAITPKKLVMKQVRKLQEKK
ncbi:SDR family oxidoreductase [Dokdonia sinensis]|uniref:SDR family oxidoreductase n=1 Tax=Dokdonia sinensis TaxID=2479847 RepID=A0A3M0GGE5_9FLAO|nr:SDR family oxidoreductase [Dokdonia sinensis]RMB63358.1 SDR family oxidoreductase [Dokdonia sinensis]